MKYTIKKATVEDLPIFADLCVALVRSQNLPFKVGGPICVENYVKDFIRDDSGFCYIAICDDPGQYHNKVVGWIGASCSFYTFSDEPIIQVRAWDVAPEHRAEGIGGALYMKVVEEAQYRNVKVITVGVNKDSSDTPELAFNKLEKLGFKEFERTFFMRLS